MAITLSHCIVLGSRLKIFWGNKINYGSWAKRVRIRLNLSVELKPYSVLLPTLKKTHLL